MYPRPGRSPSTLEDVPPAPAGFPLRAARWDEQYRDHEPEILRAPLTAADGFWWGMAVGAGLTAFAFYSSFFLTLLL